MGTKALNANQHIPLHGIYGEHDCCLCKADARIAALEAELEEARKRVTVADPCDRCDHYDEHLDGNCDDCLLKRATYRISDLESKLAAAEARAEKAEEQAAKWHAAWEVATSTDEETSDHTWVCPKHGPQHGPNCMKCGNDDL